MTIEEIREYNEKKVKEIIEFNEQGDKQAQEAFEKRIGREWEKHVKRCINRGKIIDNNFIMKVRGDRLPYYMEKKDYSYTNNSGAFRVRFKRAGQSWFCPVYYYVVQNIDLI